MASLVSHRLSRDLLGVRGNITFESLGQAVTFMTNHSTVIDSDVKDNLPKIVSAAGGDTVYDLTPEMLVRKTACTKQIMSSWLIGINKSLNFANEMLKVANSTINKLQSAAIEDKETVIKLQKEVISIINEQLQSVSTTVQSEMKTYCDIFKKSSKKAVVTQEELTKVIKTVAEEDRGKNLMVFGLK
jgi:hypothetical protein